VVAAQSLLATALIALATSAAAVAASPAVRIQSADQAKAVAALLRRSDFGTGWQGGEIGASALDPPSCPGFDPDEADLVVSGHADARFTFAPGDVVLDQDVEVLASAAAVRRDFARTISPKLPPCLAYQLQRAPDVVSASVAETPFPPTGNESAAFRATVVVRSLHLKGTLLSDFVFFAAGPVEYSFNVTAPVGARNQLERFEHALAQILLKRAGAA
jgi:hypothetical protein